MVLLENKVMTTDVGHHPAPPYTQSYSGTNNNLGYYKQYKSYDYQCMNGSTNYDYINIKFR